MKIAKLIVGNPNNRKGFFNNVIERTNKLIERESEVRCFIIRVEHSKFLKLLKNIDLKNNFDEYVSIDQIKFRNLWVEMGLINYLLAHKFHKNIVIDEKALLQYVNIFKDYDLVSAHGVEAIFLAHLIKNELGIPYVATWHGSDINVTPFKSKQKYSSIKNLLSNADHNFFVSEKLLKKSQNICSKSKSSVLYTGPSSYFYKYTDELVKSIEHEYNIKTKYVIGFIGNLIPIKNVLILPEIFKLIQEKLNTDVSFVIVGDGILQGKFEELIKEYNISNVKFLGKMEPKDIPKVMNILDVLILPSLNEGMPRVLLEAQSCGVHCVGSDRGGIPEAIGIENCFVLDDNFVINAANRIITILVEAHDKPKLSEKFSWHKALQSELMVYQNVISK